VELLSEDDNEILLFKKWFPRGYVGLSIMSYVRLTLELMEEEE
jgi:hypothetical protein